MNVEEQEKRLLDYKWHERRYSKDTCYILSTQGTEEPNILSTDNALSEDEIIRIYGMRWNIETFFKASKSMLKLGREFQTRSYDSAVAHTAIVFCPIYISRMAVPSGKRP